MRLDLGEFAAEVIERSAEEAGEALDGARVEKLTAEAVKAAYENHRYADDFGYPLRDKLRKSVISVLCENPVEGGM